MGKVCIGIDPGKHGGIAVIDEDGNVIDVRKMPDTPQDLLELLSEYKQDSFCFLEKVGGMPGNAANAMFNFGRGYGHIEMALLALNIPTTTVTPNKWEKRYQLGSRSKCASKAEWKNKLKAKAQQMFPALGRKITLDTCDALLLADYGQHF